MTTNIVELSIQKIEPRLKKTIESLPEVISFKLLKVLSKNGVNEAAFVIQTYSFKLTTCIIIEEKETANLDNLFHTIFRTVLADL